MNKLMYPILVLGVSLSGSIMATARQDNVPPTITSVSWEVSPNLDGDALGQFGPFQAFNPAVDRARELDLLRLTITVSDPDFAAMNDENVYIAQNSFWLPLNGFLAPEPPPIRQDTPAFVGPFSTTASPLVLVAFISVPEFSGKSQARLRGLVDWDVRWLVQFIVSNSQTTDQVTPGVTIRCGTTFNGANFWCENLHAVENPALRPPNAPPFANAGRDLVVAAGTTVKLDGSETFDSFNLGFNGGSVDVFEKDRLEFVWEWTSGPERVIPIVRDPLNAPAVAEVTLNTLGTYTYRLITDDGVNALPSTDSLVIEVVTDIPENRAPIAVAIGPTQAVTVGAAITLDGTGSFDPDGDPLGFLWQQTDELGGRIPSDDIGRFFQPLSGIDTPVSRWQTTKTGIFHFRLLVDDGEFVDSTRISIEVVDTQTAGFVAVKPGAALPNSPADLGASADAAPTQTPSQVAPLCGAGLFPLAFIPLALFFMRGNRRR